MDWRAENRAGGGRQLALGALLSLLLSFVLAAPRDAVAGNYQALRLGPTGFHETVPLSSPPTALIAAGVAFLVFETSSAGGTLALGVGQLAASRGPHAEIWRWTGGVAGACSLATALGQTAAFVVLDVHAVSFTMPRLIAAAASAGLALFLRPRDGRAESALSIMPSVLQANGVALPGVALSWQPGR